MGGRTTNEANEDLVFFGTMLSAALIASRVDTSLILRSEKRNEVVQDL